MNVIAPFPRYATPGREPPHDFAIEQAVLGAILVDNRTMHALADFLRPEHFADPLHGMIFNACRTLIDRSVVASPHMVAGLLTPEDFKDHGGPLPYVSKLAVAAIHTMDALDYARRLVELHDRRRLADIGQRLIHLAHDARDRGPRELIAETETELCAIGGQMGERMRDSRATVSATLNRVEAAAQDRLLPEAERDAGRIITGLPELDKKLQINRGDLIFVAGATSMGKSALADCIAEANEARGIPSAVFAMEMSAEQWATRRLSRLTGISSRRMMSGEMSARELDQIVRAGRELEARPHWIDDSAGLSVGQIRSRLRRLKRQHNIGLAIVDYLQLMQPDDGIRRAGTRAEELGQMTRALKALALELELVLIVPSQVNRGIDARDDKRPTLGDLRESGSIEQDANAVLFVYREEYYLARGKPTGRGGKPPSYDEEMQHMTRLEASRGKAEIAVAKQREGEAPVTIHCRWDGIRTRFHDGGLT